MTGDELEQVMHVSDEVLEQPWHVLITYSYLAYFFARLRHGMRIAAGGTLISMTTDAKPATAEPAAAKAESNGQAPASSPPPLPDTPDEMCEDCAEGGKSGMGLGLLLCAVAGGLAYMGLDLIFGLSRRLAGPAESDDPE